MDIFNFNYADFLSFLLTLMRVSIVVFLLPFFGGRALPNLVKAALCIVLTLGLWPNLSFDPSYFPSHPFGISLMIFGELILGLILSLTIRCIFAATETAGQIIGFQMGFAMMNVVDPLSGTSIELTSQFTYMITLLLFLSLNGHLYLLTGFAKSFELVSPGSILVNPRVFDSIVYFSSQIFVVAIKIAAPVMIAELLVSCSLGIVARLAPQINVLFVGFPVKIAVGFFFLGIMFNLLGYFLRDIILNLDQILGSVMVNG